MRYEIFILIILGCLIQLPMSAQQMMFEDTSRIGLPYAKDPQVVKFKGRYLMYYSIPPRQWNGSESGHPHLFTDKNGRTYLFYQGNPDNGKTWLITQEEVHWTNNTPRL